MNTAALVKRQRRPVTYSLPQPEYANKHVGGVNAVDLGGEGSDSIFTGGRDGTVRMWDLSAGMPACARRFEGHGGWVNDVARVSSTHLASASSDHTVRLWDISEGSMSSSCAVALQGHTDYVMALACASERLEGKFASGGLNREIFLWDIERCLAINAAPSYLSVKNDGCVTALAGLEGVHLRFGYGWDWKLARLRRYRARASRVGHAERSKGRQTQGTHRQCSSNRRRRGW